MTNAYEVVADGPNIAATIFAQSPKEARKTFWELLGETQNVVASLEVVWDYGTDGRHPS